MTKISDITKQIEVRSAQPDIVLDDLPEQRQTYLERIKKCNALIVKMLRPLPANERVRMERIIAGNSRAQECLPQDSALFDCGVKFRSILLETLATDASARKLIQQECDRLQSRVRTVYQTKAVSKSNESAVNTFSFPSKTT